MKKTLIAAAVAGTFALPNAASAIEVVKDKLEIYGKIHVSADFLDADKEAGEPDASSVSFASNSSRIGFKGVWALSETYSMLYQVEQQIDVDEGGGEFATRNTFIGLSTGFADILFGQMDTPFKDMGKAFTVFGDTIADRRALLGSGRGESNRSNERAKNALLLRIPTELVELRAMYSPNPNTDVDDTEDADTGMYSVSALVEQGPFAVGLAYEDWENMEGDPAGGELSGWRLGGSYDFGVAKLGLIYEDLKGEDGFDSDALSREAYGANVSFAVTGSTKIKAQYLRADDADDVSGSGADMYSIGAESKIAKNTTVYAIYSTVQNDDAAGLDLEGYQGIDGGHGDELDNIADGGDASAVSLGLVWKF